MLDPLQLRAVAKLGSRFARAALERVHQALPASVEIAHPRAGPERKVGERGAGGEQLGRVRVAGQAHDGLDELARSGVAQLALQVLRERDTVE